MTGYARKWDCPTCGREEEAVDWPCEGDEQCDVCRARKRLSEALAAAPDKEERP